MPPQISATAWLNFRRVQAETLTLAIINNVLYLNIFCLKSTLGEVVDKLAAVPIDDWSDWKTAANEETPVTTNLHLFVMKY